MTLKEAIEHCKEVSNTCSNTECAKEHLQLITWLKELQFYRDKYQKSNKTIKLIDKSVLIAEIERRRDAALTRQYNLEVIGQETVLNEMIAFELNRIIFFLDNLEVKEPYEQRIQYASIEAGIQAHAETYSFNIESELFNQLTKEQQVLWRKEIEQACISGGYCGIGLAKDRRYDEIIEVKNVDLDKEIENAINEYYNECEKKLQEMNDNDTDMSFLQLDKLAKHFFELGLKARK